MPNNNAQLVHENEAQRRHARVKLPAKIVFHAAGCAPRKFEVTDLSASGFGVEVEPGTLTENQHYSAELLFKINSVEVRLPIMFMVLHISSDAKKAGCEFDQLGSEELSLLHLVIGKYLAGELVISSDILSTLSRDNFTKARSKTKVEPLHGWRKARALIGTSFAACVGAVAFSFVCYNLYQHYLVTRAVTAMIDIDHEIIESPSNGYIELISVADNTVKQGKPIASISSPVIEYISGANKTLFERDDIQELLPDTINSVVKSPCDGIIIDTRIDNDVYTQKGDPLFLVAKKGDEPYIKAAFKYTDADELPIGKNVRLQFPGETSQFEGTITDIQVDIDTTANQVIAIIQPAQSLSYTKLKKPINVFVSSGLPLLSSSIDNLSSIASTVVKAR